MWLRVISWILFHAPKIRSTNQTKSHEKLAKLKVLFSHLFKIASEDSSSLTGCTRFTRCSKASPFGELFRLLVFVSRKSCKSCRSIRRPLHKSDCCTVIFEPRWIGEPLSSCVQLQSRTPRASGAQCGPRRILPLGLDQLQINDDARLSFPTTR